MASGDGKGKLYGDFILYCEYLKDLVYVIPHKHSTEVLLSFHFERL